MKIPLNPGLKPVNSPTLYILMACFLLLNILGLSGYYLTSWADEQIRMTVRVYKTGYNSYEIDFGDQGVANLSSKEADKIVAFENSRVLTEEQQDIVISRYLEVLEKFPTRLYLYMDEHPLSRTIFLSVTVGYVIANIVFGILILVMLARAWRSLQTLPKIDPAKSSGLISPRKCVWFLFIPLFQLYWLFRVFGGLEKKGYAFAARTGSKYQGPSQSLGIWFACFCVWNVLTFRTPDFDFMSPPWMINMITGILSLIIWPRMAFKLNAMTKTFAEATIDDDDPVWVLTSKSRAFDNK